MVFAVLKVIGWALLLILAFLLIALLLLLFLPFRYKIYAEGDKERKHYYGRADVTWLLSFLHASYAIGGEKDDKGLSIKILGIRLRKGKKAKEAEKSEWEPPEAEKAALTLPDSREGSDGPAEERQAENEKACEAEEVHSSSEEEGICEEDRSDEKASLWEKLKGFPGVLNDLRKKAFRIFLSLGKGVDSAINTIKGLFGKVAFYIEFFDDPATERALKLVIGELKRLIKAIMPKKCEAYLHIGMEDPALTGGILGGLSALGMVHGHSLEVKPEFEEEVLEGHFLIKGSLSLYIIVIIVCRLYFDKDLRPAWRRFKRGKRR